VGRRCSWPARAACASPETGLANLFPDRAVGVSGMAPRASPFHPLAALRVFIASGHAGVHGRATTMIAHRTAILIAIPAPILNLQVARAAWRNVDGR
jgi:hypothetical protein